MSFRTRLVLAAAYLLTAVVVALEVPLALNVERRAHADFEAAVLGDAAILAARVSDLVVDRAAPSRLATVVREPERAWNERVVVTDARGRVLADTAGLAARGAFYATAQRPELRVALFEGRIASRRRLSASLGADLLLVTVPVVDRERVVGAVRVSATTTDVEADVRGSWLRLAAIGFAVVAVGLVLAWVLAAPLGRQVRRLADAAGQLGRGDLGARAPEEGPKELETLARSFNRMASALADSVESQRDFVANASHQLRTPLTGLRLRLEAIKDEGGWTGEQAAKAEVELDRLSALVDDLLALARASSSEAAGRTIELAEAAQDAAARWRAPAADAGKRLALRTQGRPVVWADPTDVAHVLDNLIENAVRYAPPETEVSVEAAEAGGGASLIVADGGPGIPEADRARVFERFYRGANGRQAGPGTGLGLAIVAELVRRWGGDVRLLDGPGTRVQATFPRVPTDS